MQVQEKLAGGWHLDTYSTILSRRNELHKRVGKLLYVKPNRADRERMIRNSSIVIRTFGGAR